MARICHDGPGLLGLRGRGDRLGRRPPVPTTPTPTRHDDVHSPNRGFAWAHMLWWLTPDVTSVHSEDYYMKWAPDLMTRTRSTAGWTSISS